MRIIFWLLLLRYIFFLSFLDCEKQYCEKVVDFIKVRVCSVQPSTPPYGPTTLWTTPKLKPWFPSGGQPNGLSPLDKSILHDFWKNINF